MRLSELDFECQHAMFGPNSNVQNDFEFQNTIFGPNSNVKIGFRMSKYDITETSPYKSDTRFPSNIYLKWGKSGV